MANYSQELFLNFGDGCTCFYASVRSNQLKGLAEIKNVFWKTVLCTWLDNNFDYHECNNSLLWNNTYIKYQGNVLFFRDWVTGNVLTVKDFLRSDDQCITFDNICHKIGYSPNRLLEYNVVLAAVSTFIRSHDVTILDDTFLQDIPHFRGKKLSTLKEFRKALVEKTYSQPCCIGFWNRKFHFDITDKVWSIAKNATKEVRLHLLHWKIIHNIYPTNIMLHKMKVREDDKCCFCRDVVDVVEHFFYECPITLAFWKHVENYILIHMNTTVKLNALNVLFGLEIPLNSIKKVNKINHIILIGKMCISIFRKTHSYVPIKDIFENHIRLRLR